MIADEPIQKTNCATEEAEFFYKSEPTIEMLDCQPGDTIIFKLHGLCHCQPDRVLEIKNFIKRQLPDGVNVLLFDKEGTDISIVRVNKG